MDYHHSYSTTNTSGESAHIPTPVEISIDAAEYLITVKGADGQQVIDVITQTLHKLPGKQRDSNGFFEFCAGIVFFSLLAAGLVNVITWIIQPQPQPQLTNQIKPK